MESLKQTNQTNLWVFLAVLGYVTRVFSKFVVNIHVWKLEK